VHVFYFFAKIVMSDEQIELVVENIQRIGTLEKNLPGVGSAFGFTAKLSDQIKINSTEETKDAAAYGNLFAETKSIVPEATATGISKLNNLTEELNSKIPKEGNLIIEQVASVSKVAATAFKSTVVSLPAIVGKVGTTVVSAVSAIDGNDVANVMTMALNVVGTTAAVFPFLLPLQIALRDIGNSVQQATYNRESADILGKRCAECSLLANDMAPKIKLASETSKSDQSWFLQPVIDAINECTMFLDKFTKKGFLRVMLSWKNDGRSLTLLDKKVTDSIQNLSIRLDGTQIDLHLSNADKLDQLFNILTNESKNNRKKGNKRLDAGVLADVATQAGCTSASEVSSELESVGVKLDEINKTVNKLFGKVEVIDKKIDLISEKLTSEFAIQKEDTNQLKNILLQTHAENKKRENMTLAAMRAIAEHKPLVQHKFSTKDQMQYLAKRAKEALSMTELHHIVLHPYGVGTKSRKKNNGRNGRKGSNGTSHGTAPDGVSGGYRCTDGGDGHDGNDGGEGQRGEAGEDGVDTPEFQITIEFLSEDAAKGVRKYRIEHAGPNGKDETTIHISYKNTFLFIDGKGGNGGRG
jgi:hypothetical protein